MADRMDVMSEHLVEGLAINDIVVKIVVLVPWEIVPLGLFHILLRAGLTKDAARFLDRLRRRLPLHSGG
eukprot:6342166-Pyramimonas_sp.AAC.1